MNRIPSEDNPSEEELYIRTNLAHLRSMCDHDVIEDNVCTICGQQHPSIYTASQKAERKNRRNKAASYTSGPGSSVRDIYQQSIADTALTLHNLLKHYSYHNERRSGGGKV